MPMGFLGDSREPVLVRSAWAKGASPNKCWRNQWAFSCIYEAFTGRRTRFGVASMRSYTFSETAYHQPP